MMRFLAIVVDWSSILLVLRLSSLVSRFFSSRAVFDGLTNLFLFLETENVVVGNLIVQADPAFGGGAFNATGKTAFFLPLSQPF
jgi:hypothetical protein